MGFAENGGLIEVLTFHQGRAFTIIVSTPDVQTCMVAACADYNDYSERSKKFLNAMRPGVIHEVKSNIASDDCQYVPVNCKKLILLIENLLEQGKRISVRSGPGTNSVRYSHTSLTRTI